MTRSHWRQTRPSCSDSQEQTQYLQAAARHSVSADRAIPREPMMVLTSPSCSADILLQGCRADFEFDPSPVATKSQSAQPS